MLPVAGCCAASRAATSCAAPVLCCCIALRSSHSTALASREVLPPAGAAWGISTGDGIAKATGYRLTCQGGMVTATKASAHVRPQLHPAPLRNFE
jgi:hypothetical protein